MRPDPDPIVDPEHPKDPAEIEQQVQPPRDPETHEPLEETEGEQPGGGEPSGHS